MSNTFAELHHLNRVVGQRHARDQELTERIQCELRFAALLCDLHPEHDRTWRPLIAEARHVMESARPDSPGLAALVAGAETILAPLAKVAKSYQVQGIGHAHIDMNWQWSWPETVGIVIDTFSTVLRLMDEFPEFHFTQSQAEIYQIVEEHAPDLLARIAVQVRAGRWEVAASHWVEGDKNLANGESLCRQVLYAKQYLMRLFGLSADDLSIDWAPDTFGHPATMPTYLAQAGIRYSFLHRPGAHAEQWPQAFRWQGQDASEVLVFNGMRGGYNGVFCPRMILDRVSSWYSETGMTLAPYMYGVGDHGGGPTRRDLLRFREIRTWPIFPAVQLGTAGAFFADLATKIAILPVVKRELNFAFTGCYTSQSLLKKANRIGENRLDDAERAAAFCSTLLGSPYPTGRLTAAWSKILFSQFHDILPGSCVHDSRTFSHGLFQQSMATTSQIETQSLRALAAVIGTDTHPRRSAGIQSCAFDLRSGFSGGAGIGTAIGDTSQGDISSVDEERQLVLFHLDQGERQEVVETVIWENARDYANLPFHRQSFTAQVNNGAPQMAQILEQGTLWGHDFVRLAFPAIVPGVGYTHCTIGEAAGTEPMPPAGAWQLGREDWPARYSFHDLAEEGLENSALRVELDAKTGGLRRLLDKRNGIELVTPTAPSAMLEYGIERAHAMNSWAIDHAHDLKPLTCVALRRISKGPHLASIEVDFTIGSSHITLTYELRRDDPRLHLRIRGTWREIGSAQVGVPFLLVSITTALRLSKLTCEIPFGSAEREFNAGEEVPGLQWGMVRGRQEAGRQQAEKVGLLLLNDSKYGYSLDGNTLRLSLIRSSYDPDPLPEVGQHDVRLALLPIASNFSVADAVRAGRWFNHPIRVIGTDRHAGQLPSTGQLLQIAPDMVTVLAIKQAEDGSDELVIRLNNPEAQAQTISIAAGSALKRQLLEVQACDVMERPLPGQPLQRTRTNNALTVALPATGLCTLRLRLGEHL